MVDTKVKLGRRAREAICNHERYNTRQLALPVLQDGVYEYVPDELGLVRWQRRATSAVRPFYDREDDPGSWSILVGNPIKRQINRVSNSSGKLIACEGSDLPARATYQPHPG